MLDLFLKECLTRVDQVDGWRRRYPTHVGDVAAACVGLAELRGRDPAVRTTPPSDLTTIGPACAADSPQPSPRFFRLVKFHGQRGQEVDQYRLVNILGPRGHLPPWAMACPHPLFTLPLTTGAG